LEPSARSLLVGIQESFNEALRNEKKSIPEHVPHPPFHLDYVDSAVPNALAFRYEGYSFIGITMALFKMLWDTCGRLSRSEALTTLLGVRLTPDEYEQIHVVLLQTQLSFVVSHEYTHHVHGHVIPRGSDSIFPNEILDCHASGSLRQQAQEVDADGYAVYHVLAHLIDGERRPTAARLLGHEAASDAVQDEALFSSFVAAVGAFLLVCAPATVDSDRVYKLQHPPQAARMNFVMQYAIRWCTQNRRRLETWTTIARFQMLMSAAAVATWGMNGGRDWGAQTAFLQSSHGSEYVRQLEECVKAHIQSL